jgi:hypothetical protein
MVIIFPTVETIDEQVTKTSSGFTLGIKEGKIFHVHYVGGSDVDVNAKSKEYVGKYRVKFDNLDLSPSDAASTPICRSSQCNRTQTTSLNL